MEAKIYNQKGKEVEAIKLPARVFAAKWRSDLVHQVLKTHKNHQNTKVQ
jgi:ribosomal protein L4